MPSTIDIRRRIRSVKNTQQITKAMKMVAAAKLRRAQERMFAPRPYASALRYVVFNEFKSLIAQSVRVVRLLPLERSWDDLQNVVDYLYEPSPDAILNDILPKHIEFQLYRILLESAAAEQGARMTAMEAATKNASEMISHLTLTYNRIRQAAITKEIIEIVSGAAAAQ